MTPTVARLRAVLRYKHGRSLAEEVLNLLRRNDTDSLQDIIYGITRGTPEERPGPEDVEAEHIWMLGVLVRMACGRCSTGRAMGLLEVDFNRLQQILEYELAYGLGNGHFGNVEESDGRGVSPSEVPRIKTTRGKTPQRETKIMSEKTAAIEGLANIETLAASKAIAAKVVKTAREGLDVGVHEVSFDIHVEGTVTVGEDFEQRMVNKAQPWNIIAALLEENARVSEAAGETGINIDKIIKAAEAMDPDMVKRAKKQAETAAASIKAATLSPAKGKVTTKLSATPIS